MIVLRRVVVVMALGSAATAATAVPALAQSGASPAGRDAQIVLSGRLDVPRGDTASSGVVFDGDANVAGTLTESLVVFNGDATISGTVRKDVFVFNGGVTLQPGATVGGDVVSRDRATIPSGATVSGQVKGVENAFNLAESGLWSRLAWWLGYTISTLLLGLLLLALAPRFDRAMAGEPLARKGAAFGLGALAFVLLPIVAVLLLAIVIAVPLGLFVLLGLALIYTVGYVAGAHVVGRAIVKLPRSRFAAFLAGWAILRVIALVPILGGICWIVATMVGLGALLLAARAAPDRTPAMPDGEPLPAV